MGGFSPLPRATSPPPLLAAPPSALPSAAVLHGDVAGSSSSSLATAAAEPLAATSPAATTTLSAAAAAVLRDTLTLSAWAAAEVGPRDASSSSSSSSSLEWGAALAPAPHAAGLRWGLAAGRPLRGAACAEAFLHCGGGGWTLTPALVVLRGRGAAALLRAHTTF